MTHILSIFEVHDKNPDDVNNDIEIISAGMFFCMLKFKRIRVSLVYQKKKCRYFYRLSISKISLENTILMYYIVSIW